jgi:hypothetical protein
MSRIKVKTIFIIIFVISAFSIKRADAQSEPMFSKYTFNEILIKPANAGFYEFSMNYVLKFNSKKITSPRNF